MLDPGLGPGLELRLERGDFSSCVKYQIRFSLMLAGCSFVNSCRSGAKIEPRQSSETGWDAKMELFFGEELAASSRLGLANLLPKRIILLTHSPNSHGPRQDLPWIVA
jgi:hypothetical protein